MAIKIDIHSIANANGTGTPQPFVKMIPEPARTAEELEEEIQRNCTLTRSDVRAVLTALHDIVGRDLAERGTFHLPQIGYLTLRLANSYPKDADIEKLKGNYVGVRGIRFRPEIALLKEVQGQARFERLKGTTRSKDWTEEALREALVAYLHDKAFITARQMQFEFGLTRYSAHRWLSQFTDEGLLSRQGARNSPFYTLK